MLKHKKHMNRSVDLRIHEKTGSPRTPRAMVKISMEITSKQRAYLRSLAADIPTIMQIGKDGVGDNLIKTVSDALEARELIKLSVLDNCGETPRSAAESLAAATDATVVATIGRKLILYRESETKKTIEL